MRAQRINGLLNGVAVLPWELDRIPDEWMMAFEMITDDLPETKSGFAELDAAYERKKMAIYKKQ